MRGNAIGWTVRIGIGMVRLYQWTVSPLLHAFGGPGSGCRFQPTCSEYARVSFLRHGLGRGGLLVLRRIRRCHPWGGSGYDPVPGEDAEAGGSARPSGCGEPARRTELDAAPKARH